MPDICEVCEGSGEYPIHARGKHVYDITCPECGGDGNATDDKIPAPRGDDMICDGASE